MGQGTKTNEFSEKFQMAFDPLHFKIIKKIKIILQFLSPKKPCLKVKNLQHNFLD